MSEGTRRWTGRVLVTVVLWLVVVTVATYFGNQPRLLLLALGFAAFASVLWLYLDASAEHEVPLWESAADDPVREPGEDTRLALLRRVVDQHQDAREVGDGLHTHLVQLADHRLVTRHGVAWRSDPVRAEPLLGPELTALARQQPPYPRLRPDQIDALLRRIESL
ncbi:MAG: hypothetical protein HOQ22_17660 [Nocardioidaceae bacterium]|nr:hypothetical protein [Nocardioidaceae bacterium]NUS52852.1 hypothetical protein [Nocardioidaceae bacterium]